MLAVAAPEPFDSDQYLFEIKWDGIRCLAFVESKGMRLQSRQLLDITAQSPELECLRQLPGGTVLDGELVVLRDGKPWLSKVQQRVQLQDRHRIRFLSQRSPVVYVVFDLLYLRGQSVMAEPLVSRKEALRQTLGNLRVPSVVVADAVVGRGRAVFAGVKRLGLEGMMAKRLDSRYSAGKRSRAWLKVKI